MASVQKKLDSLSGKTHIFVEAVNDAEQALIKHKETVADIEAALENAKWSHAEIARTVLVKPAAIAVASPTSAVATFPSRIALIPAEILGAGGRKADQVTVLLKGLENACRKHEQVRDDELQAAQIAAIEAVEAAAAAAERSAATKASTGVWSIQPDGKDDSTTHGANNSRKGLLAMSDDDGQGEDCQADVLR